jgi:hypothetical protein
MEEEEDQFQQLSGSSKKAVEWAFTRSQDRAKRTSQDAAGSMVSAADLLVGIFLSHPKTSGPDQLLEHFQVDRKKVYDMLKATGFTPEDSPRETPRLSKLPPLDTGAASAIEKSIELSRSNNPEQPSYVRLRDLFGGLLLSPNEAKEMLRKVLSAHSAPFDELQNTYPEFLRHDSKEMEYRNFLRERFQAAAGGEAGLVRFTVSGFSADSSLDQSDYVGIGAEVDAFAYLIAARELKPPLAIGLFGDWGSGKSFFMEALRNRIHQITEDAKRSNLPPKGISIYKYIAQIEFNAWHYVEGELWASLVEHIFQNLRTRPEEEVSLLAQRQKHWIDQLESARRAQLEAQERKAELEVQLSQARDVIKTLEKDRDKTLKDLQKLQASDVLEAIQLTDPEKAQISQTMKDLGVTETYTSAADFIQAVQELRAVLDRGNALITPLRERGWRWALAIIVVIFAGPAVSLLLANLSDVPILTNALASVSAFLSGLTILLKNGTDWLSGAVGRVETAQLQLEAKRREAAKDYASKIAIAENEYAQKQAAHQQAQENEQVIQRQIEEIEQELKRITPARILYDFITERVGSEDYRKRLGVAALIRRDFDQLSKLIAEQNNDYVKREDGHEQTGDENLINRIVLYIDDLDRCPPETVVKVLQAVHLLLAFPLFVVVVAVDARWLAQSLQSYYKDLLSASRQEQGLDLNEGFARQASPQNYLEKIFQVPFWVRPLTEPARVRLVRGMLHGSLPKPQPESTGPNGYLPEPDQASPDDVGEKSKKLAVQWPEEKRIRPVDEPAATDLQPSSLDIEPIELKFMEDLQCLLGETPRSVKRFVNVYRLVKALALSRSSAFVEDTPYAPFKKVQFLLAVLTGRPTISRGFFRLLQENRFGADETKMSGSSIYVGPSSTLGDVISALRRVITAQTPMATSMPANSLVAQPDEQLFLVNDPIDDLECLESWVRGQGWMDYHAADFAEWTSEAARFSYRLEEP